jgi:uncharacterized protein YeaO (DUF488 family)
VVELALKRVYEKAAEADGRRILVDRVWPRGLSKNKAGVDYWARDVAPSTQLRKWFNHDPEKWDGFKRRYFEELDRNRDAVEALREQIGTGRATLLFASREERFSNARVLKRYLEDKR